MVTATPTPEDTRPIGPTDRWTPLRYHAGQAGYWLSDKRFTALPCGRRSGKTELAKRKLVRSLRVRVPGCRQTRYAFAAPTQDQARAIAWDDLLALIPDHWIAGGKTGPNVSYSRLEINTVYGSQLRVVGLDKPHRVEGGYFNGFVGDEWSDIRPGTFDKVIRPMLGDYNGWATLCGVPKRQGIGSIWFREFCEKIAGGDYPDAAVFQWPASDIIDSAELKHAQETLDPKDYAEQYDARWQTAGGGIFYAFDRAYNVRPCYYHPEMPILVGSDFNVDPMAWVLGHRFGNRLEWFDEIWLRNTNTPQALEVLTGRYADHKGGWQLYGDASGQARKTSATFSDFAHIHNHEALKRMGRTLHYTPANPAVDDRFSACNAMWCNAAGERRMFVDPNCKHLISDMENRSYKLGTREPADSGDVGHISDACGYVVHALFPIRVEVKTLNRVLTGAR